MLHISPGVYVNIVDQSEYVNASPVTTVFVPFFSDKGIDNKLAYINGQRTLRSEYLVEDFTKQGKNFREGWMCLDRWLAISGSSYGIRLLPDDASYATLMLSIVTLETGEKVLALNTVPDMNSEKELDTLIGGSTLAGTKPIYVISAIGRGEWYNNLGVNITPLVNEENVYAFDIYEHDANGDLYISKTFKVGFHEGMTDIEGESIFVEDVVEKYSDLFKVRVNPENIRDLATFKSADDVLGIVTEAPEAPANGDRYLVGIGASGAFVGHDNEFAVWNEGETQWEFSASALRGYVVFVGEGEEKKQYLFDGDDWSIFDPFCGMFSAASPTDFDYKMLGSGSSGSLVDANGNIQVETAKQLLVKAYHGLIDPGLLDTEYVYFPYVMCPYPLVEVSDAAVKLSQEFRMDCFTFTTLPDSTSPDEDIETKQRSYSYNTWYAALYGNYSRVYQADLGRSIWVSPIYHIANAMPYTLNVGTLSDAPAGFDHAMCPEAKQLRYNPQVGDRDNLYIDRVNYLATFKNGTCIYQQLTTQMKDSSLSDINVVNVVLYVTRTIKTFCNNFLYYKNTSETHDSIRRSLDEFLKDQKDRGNLQNYTIDVGATEYEYKLKKCHVNVVMWPTKILEKIEVTEYIR